MQVHVLHHHHGKNWPRPLNHLDSRECPTCGSVVSKEAQKRHHDRHLEERERDMRVTGWLVELAKRCGITEEEVAAHIGQDWSWGAQVTGVEAEIEGSSDA